VILLSERGNRESDSQAAAFAALITGEQMAEAEVKRRGRPSKGDEAKTSTERAKDHDAALIASGGRILNRVRISAEAAEALLLLNTYYKSDRAAIEAAVLYLHKHRRGKV
jgi:hypothetical protein